MRYQIKMSSGEKYFIIEEEAQKIAGGEIKGLVFVPSLKGFINLSFVISVVPEDRIDSSNLSNGRLHDGTRVMKKFGQWVPVNNPEAHLDPDYYPEAYEDNVMSEEEYQQKQLLLASPNYENQIE